MTDYGLAGPVSFRWSRLNNGRIDVDGASGDGYSVCPRGRHRLAAPFRFTLIAGKVLASRQCRRCPVVKKTAVHGPRRAAIRLRILQGNGVGININGREKWSDT